MDDTKLAELADRIYSEVYGEFDSKALRSERTGEIYDWLAEGDHVEECGLDDLVAEWREYVAEEDAN